MDESQPCLFDDDEPAPAPRARGHVERDYAAPTEPVNGRFFGKGATQTERESGIDVELADFGPLQPDSAGHVVLRAYASGGRLTAYEASRRSAGDFHQRRRESTRLVKRGFLVKDGVLANTAPGGRAHVDAYRITPAGLAELERLERLG